MSESITEWLVPAILTATAELVNVLPIYWSLENMNHGHRSKRYKDINILGMDLINGYFVNILVMHKFFGGK